MLDSGTADRVTFFNSGGNQMIGYYDKSQVVLELREKLEGKKQAELAAEMEITPQYLSDVLSGRRDPGPKILDYLGLKIGYVRSKED